MPTATFCRCLETACEASRTACLPPVGPAGPALMPLHASATLLVCWTQQQGPRPTRASLWSPAPPPPPRRSIPDSQRQMVRLAEEILGSRTLGVRQVSGHMLGRLRASLAQLGRALSPTRVRPAGVAGGAHAASGHGADGSGGAEHGGGAPLSLQGRPCGGWRPVQLPCRNVPPPAVPPCSGVCPCTILSAPCSCPYARSHLHAAGGCAS